MLGGRHLCLELRKTHREPMTSVGSIYLCIQRIVNDTYNLSPPQKMQRTVSR